MSNQLIPIIMDQYGKIISPGTLRFERLLPGPIERVWEYLTDSKKRGLWLASGPMELWPGGKFEMFFKHDRLSPADDPIPEKYREMKDGVEGSATILKSEPPHLLTFTWEDSEVSIELTEQADKVLLVLTNSKLPDDKETRTGTAAGWHTHLNILQDRLESKDPQGFWSVHLPLEKEYVQRLGY